MHTTIASSPTNAAPPAGVLPTRPPAIRRRLRPDGVCILTFDRPNSSANLFDEATLHELADHLEALRDNSRVRALVITSAKPSIFIAGADIDSIIANPDPSEVGRLIRLGQNVFSQLAGLAVPTAAAIHGACVGGGFELALACDLRIASPDKATKIGLPETQLGILPAWGGSTRLPRLIGLPGALDLILGGKVMPARAALKRGLIDEVVPAENLVRRAAERLLHRDLPTRPSHGLTNNPASAALIGKVAARKSAAKTRNHYPAITRAVEVVSHAAYGPIEHGLARERDAVLDLATTPEARNLIRLFFLTERAKKLRRHDPATPPPTAAAVVGAGVMGAGIAQWCATRGLDVLLTDVAATPLAHGMATVDKLNAEATRRHLLTHTEALRARDRITPSFDRVPMLHTDMVIEAAVEKLDVKRQIFADLDARSGHGTILATNTSALPVGEIARATAHPDRVVGIHFFNPVHRMKLVEVVVADTTSDETVLRAIRFVQHIGKLPVVVRDRPGFVVNRILMPYLVGAGFLFESGVPAADIDQAMLAFGMPMGPLRLLDEVGNDVALHVADTLADAFGDRFPIPEILRELVATDRLGRKTGHGFYEYRGGKEILPEHNLSPHVPHPRTSLAQISAILVALMVNEAARCLEEKVAATPDDIDFAMVMGTGFAPFRGGPLRHADAVDPTTIAGLLDRLAQETGSPRFTPCDLLRTTRQFHHD
ncbi:fatty acid oxidation complex subunit alpha FadJ [soil metagenome]